MFSREFIFQIFALIISVIVVHTAYVAVIRPKANAFLEVQKAQMEAGKEDASTTRSVYVLTRDFEQEACFILMFWALAIMGYKFSQTGKERGILRAPLIAVSEGIRILPEDTVEVARNIEALPKNEQGLLLPRTLLAGLSRFRATRNVQDVSTTIGDLCETESERLDSELSMVRYIAWAIPSIGFIGTVRGIGQALSRAHLAVEGDIGQVTDSLGVAFNSTLIALLISIVLMFVVHQLQLTQERLVMEVERRCNDDLAVNLYGEREGS